jgi:hypothetical protein
MYIIKFQREALKEKWYDFAGTRFQAAGNTVEEKNVVSEHEDQAHSSCHHNCIDSHYCSFCVPWLQLLKILIYLEFSLYIGLFCNIL